jgi:hypothetical protein
MAAGEPKEQGVEERKPQRGGGRSGRARCESGLHRPETLVVGTEARLIAKLILELREKEHHEKRARERRPCRRHP